MTGRARWILSGGMVMVSAACTPTVEAPTVPTPRAQFLRWHDAAVPPPPAGGQSANAQLSYYGGHVISNVKIYLVWWGAMVRSDIVAGFPGYYQAVTDSSYLDYLNEYDTTINAQGGGPGTQQQIGRGTYAGATAITPSNTATQLADSDISAELEAQITAGKLPPPDANTLYMTYFPPGIVITLGNSQSCVSGGFCAFHSTFQHQGQSTYFGVMPDNSPGSGCDRGCGQGTATQNLQMASSHEMTEAITDAEIGLASGGVGPPIAWYDTQQGTGEIGDICATSGTATVGQYTVQLEWSNAANNCVGTRTDTNDFSVQASPNTVTVSAGGTASISVVVSTTGGSPGAVALTAQGLPAGVTASFNPASVTPGQNSTLTLTASGSAAAAKDGVIAIVGVGGSVTHTAGLLVQVKPPPPNDFSLNLAPAQLSLTPGSSGQAQLTTAVTMGMAGAVNLSITGLPTGVTGQVSPASITSGQGATLIFNTTASTAVGSYPYTLQAQGTSTSHQATGTVSVVAGPPQPSIQFTSPAGGTTVSGTQVQVSALATNVSANAQIAVKVDGVQIGTSTGTTYSAPWDTTGFANGSHTLTATVIDAGQTGNAQTTVTVNNPLSVTVTSPAGGSTVHGEVIVTANATVVSGITLSRIELYLDATLAGNGPSSPFSLTVDTTRVADGPHTLSAKAYDSNGDVASSARVPVTVQNGSGSAGSGTLVNGGCGCGTSSTVAPWALALLAIAAAFRRRRA